MKTADIPKVKQEVLLTQKYKCAICTESLLGKPSKDHCLDHDHKTGAVRGVLCRNCNGLEGEIFNRCRRGKRGRTERWFLERLALYWAVTDGKNLYGYEHPSHRNEDEKRDLRNKKARLRRAEKKNNE